MTIVKKPRAKRKLTDISFEKEGAHIALVSKDQGGPANGRDTALVLKATAGFSEEFLEKAQRIKIEMELPQFLEKFFYVYCEDSKLLAKMMGYDPELASEDSFFMSFWEWRKKQYPDTDYYNLPEATDAEYQDYISTRLESIEVIKSLQDVDSLPEALSKLSEEDYLKMLRDQERVEKAFKVEDAVKALPLLKKTEVQLQVKPNVEQSTKSKDGETMSDVNKTEAETVQKSQFEEVQKQLRDVKEALEKANEQLEVVRKEKEEAIAKARLEKMKEAVKDEAKALVLFKATGTASDADFEEVLKALTSLQVQADDNDLFKEKGAESDAGNASEKESAVAKAVKAELAKNAKAAK